MSGGRLDSLVSRWVGWFSCFLHCLTIAEEPLLYLAELHPQHCTRSCPAFETSLPMGMPSNLHKLGDAASLKVSGLPTRSHVTDSAQTSIYRLDLRSPSYDGKTLVTEEGGVIQAPQIRIQARSIRYTFRETLEETLQDPLHGSVEARGDLLVHFGPYTLSGEALFYDFTTHSGFLERGRCASLPWFFGGKQLLLHTDGSVLIDTGYVTTSEAYPPHWGLYAASVKVDRDQVIQAKNLSLKLFETPVFWIPTFHSRLDWLLDSPFHYRFRWGGSQGPRFGLTYSLLEAWNWKTSLRFDYRLTRGPGAGIEADYRSQDKTLSFSSINYIAKDSSLLAPHEKTRYRFEGTLEKQFRPQHTDLLISYDKISDPNMPSSYEDQEFDIKPAKRTQFSLHRQETDWIAKLYARARINSFETVKQELPCFSASFRPQVLGKTGVMLAQTTSLAYLNYQYSTHVSEAKPYNAARLAYSPRFFSSFPASGCTVTPDLTLLSILYSNSPKEKGSSWLNLAKSSARIDTSFFRNFSLYTHTLSPYAEMAYTTPPTSSPHHHDIFSIEDGWCGAATWKTGFRNLIHGPRGRKHGEKLAECDLWVEGLLHPCLSPDLYTRCVLFPLPHIRYLIQAKWDTSRKQLGALNVRTEWTLDTDCALAFEYRTRNAYSWRKADPMNFYLEAFHTERVLRHSSLSDPRQTLLTHLFYRFHPNWAIEAMSRQGWGRSNEPKYLEYELNLLTTIQNAWHFRFSFQRQQHDTRVALYLNVGLKK